MHHTIITCVNTIIRSKPKIIITYNINIVHSIIVHVSSLPQILVLIIGSQLYSLRQKLDLQTF